MERIIQQQLLDKLGEFGIRYIRNIKEFQEKLLDFSVIEKAKRERSDIPQTPKINTSRKSIIIFDNHDFNETYVIDLVNAILSFLKRDDCEFQNSETKETIVTNGDEFLKTNEVDIYYVDDFVTRLKCFNPKTLNLLEAIFDINDLKVENIKNIEKKLLVPALMFFDPEYSDEINCIYERQLSQITENDILSIFAILKDKNVTGKLNIRNKTIE